MQRLKLAHSTTKVALQTKASRSKKYLRIDVWKTWTLIPVKKEREHEGHGVYARLSAIIGTQTWYSWIGSSSSVQMTFISKLKILKMLRPLPYPQNPGLLGLGTPISNRTIEYHSPIDLCFKFQLSIIPEIPFRLNDDHNQNKHRRK